MRKICLVLCCVLLLQILCSCADKNEEFENPVNFYYINKEISYNSPSGVIYAEKREGAGFHGNLTAFLHAYLQGPSDTELQTLIPSDVYLVSCSMEDNEASILFSTRFSKLSGVKLSTACTALLLTIHEYTGAETVKISAKDAKLDDEDVIVLSMDDIILMDSTSMNE